MSKKGPEATIERDVCAAAESAGFLAWKFTSPNRRGVPDRMLVSLWGLVSFWEFKRPGETIEPNSPQERRMEELGQRGIMVVVCDDVERGLLMLKAMETPEAFAEMLQAVHQNRQDNAPRIITASVPDSRH